MQTFLSPMGKTINFYEPHFVQSCESQTFECISITVIAQHTKFKAIHKIRPDLKLDFEHRQKCISLSIFLTLYVMLFIHISRIKLDLNLLFFLFFCSKLKTQNKTAIGKQWAVSSNQPNTLFKIK